MIHGFNFGGSNDPSDRGIGWGVKANGWPAFFERHVDRAIEWSQEHGQVCRIWFHNPGGQSLDENGKWYMTFLQFFDSLIEGQYWAIDGFLEEARARTGVAEIICYLGGWHNTPRCVESPEWLRGKWIWESMVTRLQNSGCSIGIDNTANRPKNDYTHYLCKWLGKKTPVYGEATPEYTQKHWWKFHSAVLWPTFTKRHLEPQHPAAVGRWPIAGQDDWYEQETVVLVWNGYGVDAAHVAMNTPGVTACLGNRLIDFDKGPEQFE